MFTPIVRAIVVCCVFGIATAPAAVAQTAGSAPRPRVGLALGGGSAKGIAHIGVLEWFEEHRIPIDFIAGTSMGGLIAGSYASGMSPRELRDLMRATDWDLMFLSDSPFDYKTFRRKQDRRAYPAQLEFGLKKGVRLPPGLNPGQQVALMLDAIALPYYGIRTFDDLPTPFRCVAMDLRTSEAIVLSRGSLARALRATMAIPGVFTPVNMEPWLLVDGGALDNIPGGVSREMGADVVVAVNVGTDRPTEEQAEGSLFSLLGQTVSAMMAAGIKKGIASADVVIDPDLIGLDGSSWRRSGELVDRGYRAAAAMADALQKYALSEADYAAFQAARRARRKTATAVPLSIEVSGVSAKEQQYLKSQFAGSLGRPIDAQRVARDILTVAGTDRYEYLTYRLEERAEGPALHITARQKTYGPPFLALGLELNNVTASSFSVSLGSRLTLYDTFGEGSEVRSDVIGGTRQGLGLEVYRPVARTPLFVAPRVYVSRGPHNLFDGERQLAEYRILRTGVGLDVGIAMSRRSEIRFGADTAYVRSSLRVGVPVLPEVKGWEQMARVQYVFDGQNSPTVPSRGVLIRTRAARYLATPDLPAAIDGNVTNPPNPDALTQAEASVSVFAPLGGGSRAFALVSGGSSFGDVPLFNKFTLGGPLRLGAYGYDQLRGSNYILAAGGFLKRTGRLPDVIGGNIFVGGWLETGSAFDERDAARWKGTASFGMVLESLLGPIFAGGSMGFDGQTRLYVAIGPLFR